MSVQWAHTGVGISLPGFGACDVRQMWEQTYESYCLSLSSPAGFEDCDNFPVSLCAAGETAVPQAWRPL